MPVRAKSRASLGAIGLLALFWTTFAGDQLRLLDISQYLHTSWTSQDGYFRGGIISVAQTSDGNLWLPSAAGLLRRRRRFKAEMFGIQPRIAFEPLEVEQWLRALKKEGHLANPTLDKTRRVMSLVYKHGQRYGLIPRNQESNPMRFVRCKTTSGYEAMILTPEQAYAIVCNLREPERTLTLLAAGTGLRISEMLGLAMA
jgi:hypothetical protein